MRIHSYRMIYGIGIDLVEVKRVAQNLDRFGERFVRRVFTPPERDYCSRNPACAPHYAARFAAKEALLKAMGTGHSRGISWQDVSVEKDQDGKPQISLKGVAASLAQSFGIVRVHVSLSHTAEHAIAYVVLETD